MLQFAKSPLARLVFFMVCLSIAGTFVAGVHYYAVDLPAQKELPPENKHVEKFCDDIVFGWCINEIPYYPSSEFCECMAYQGCPC